MEQRNLFMLALGVGVGVGLGLVSATWATPAHGEGGGGTGADIVEVEAELRRLVVDGRESEVSFDEFHNFHYYLSDQTKEVLISAAFIHLTQADLSKHIRNLSTASRAILLSGPTEPYLQSLARAFSRYYRTRLLLLDVTDFSLRIQSKYRSISKALVRNQSISEATLGRMSGFIGSFITFPNKDEPIGLDPVVLDVTAIAADRILLLNSYFTVVIFHGITIAQWQNAGYQDQEGHKVYGQLKAPDEEANTIIKERFP